jgi:hypothetical protein
MLYSFAFADAVSMHRDEYVEKRQLPVFGAFTYNVRYVESTKNPTRQSFGSLAGAGHTWLHLYNLGLSYCSPYDIPRWNIEVGEGLAVGRSLGGIDTIPLWTQNDSFSNRHLPVKELGTFASIRMIGQHSLLPRWVRHALDLEPYLALVQIGGPQGDGPVGEKKQLVLGPLAKKMFTGTEARLQAENREINTQLDSALKHNEVLSARVAVLKGALQTIHYGCEVALGG